ncbi:MAG: ATP-grasp domain-containing protein [Clostridia bacterium]|nr:ATP-grasp domain-containing protein [Clostridia bacterium]
MKSILVFFGGKSVEHDISIITGVLTLNSLDKTIFNPIPIYVTQSGEWFTGEELYDISSFKEKSFKKLTKVTLVSGSNAIYTLKKNKLKKQETIYSAINCLHGVNGEDGAIIGMLKMCNIPYASPDLFGSSLSIDKDYTKLFLSGIKVDKLPCVRILRSSFFEKKDLAIKLVERKFNYPVIVKPATLGSSIGIGTAKDKNELLFSLNNAFLYDDKVIVESELTKFKEINCAAYRLKDKIIVSECEEPITKNEILSFNDKYLGFKTGANRKMPADIPDSVRDKIKKITENIYRKADFIGVIRIDYILSNDKIYVNEINTVPGSLAYYLFVDTIKDFSKLLTNLIEEGVKRHFEYEKRKFTFSSSVLNGFGVKGAKSKPIDKK